MIRGSLDPPKPVEPNVILTMTLSDARSLKIWLKSLDDSSKHSIISDSLIVCLNNLGVGLK